MFRIAIPLLFVAACSAAPVVDFQSSYQCQPTPDACEASIQYRADSIEDLFLSATIRNLASPPPGSDYASSVLASLEVLVWPDRPYSGIQMELGMAGSFGEARAFINDALVSSCNYEDCAPRKSTTYFDPGTQPFRLRFEADGYTNGGSRGSQVTLYSLLLLPEGNVYLEEVPEPANLSMAGLFVFGALILRRRLVVRNG